MARLFGVLRFGGITPPDPFRPARLTRRRISTLALLVPLLFAGSVGTAPHVLAQSAALPRSTPEAEGVSSADILAFLEAVERARLADTTQAAPPSDPGAALKAMLDARVELHSLMIVRHGTVVAEGWWAPYSADRKHALYSLSKSFTSTAIGLAVAEGHLALDDSVVSFFPDDLPDEVSDHLAAMRVRDLITMSTGQEADGSLGRDTPNWVRSFLEQPVVHAPGSRFRYNTSATFMLSAILQQVTGETLIDYLKPRLFEPLGITDLEWETSPRGITMGGSGLKVNTEAVAKLGLLYLQNGRWNGDQLLSPEWVREATSAQIASSSGASSHEQERNDWAQGYGYQFWRTTHGAYRADGAFGQYSIVLPELDAVIAITGASRDMQAVLDLVWEHLLPAFRDEPLPVDTSRQAQLDQVLDSLTLLPPNPIASSPVAEAVSGKTYTLEDNALDARSLSFTFEPDGCVFTLTTDAGAHRLPCGIGSWKDSESTMPLTPPRLPPPLGTSATQVSATGTWTDDHTFVMTWRFVETPFYDLVTCRFDEDTVRVSFSNNLVRPQSGDPRPVLVGRLSP